MLLYRFSLSFGGAVPGYPGLIGDPSTYGLMYNISMEPHPVYSSAPISLMFAYQLTQAAYPPSIMIGAVSERFGCYSFEYAFRTLDRLDSLLVAGLFPTLVHVYVDLNSDEYNKVSCIHAYIPFRVNLSALLLFVCLWHLLIYCPLVYMTWMPLGVINSWGINDYGGDAL